MTHFGPDTHARWRCCGELKDEENGLQLPEADANPSYGSATASSSGCI